MIVNDFQKVNVDANRLLTAGRLWTTLDYNIVESPNVRGNLDWRVKRAGTGHGLVVWFDADLAEGIGFSNAPSERETVYGSFFFPWPEPVTLEPNQLVAVNLEAKLIEEDYLWRWTTRIESPEGSGAPCIHFEQSQLAGELLSVAKLHRLATTYVPHLSEEGRLRRRTFELMDGSASLEQIAHRLATEFPQRFSKWEQALSYAGAVSQEYSR
jgi:protein arginine N-methyltransferase 1